MLHSTWVINDALSSLLLGIWDVSEETMDEGSLGGMVRVWLSMVGESTGYSYVTIWSRANLLQLLAADFLLLLLLQFVLWGRITLCVPSYIVQNLSTQNLLHSLTYHC